MEDYQLDNLWQEVRNLSQQIGSAFTEQEVLWSQIQPLIDQRDAIQQEVDQLKTEADEPAEEFKAYYEEASSAYHNEDHAEAKRLSSLGKTTEQRCRKLNHEWMALVGEIKEISANINKLSNRAQQKRQQAQALIDQKRTTHQRIKKVTDEKRRQQQEKQKVIAARVQVRYNQIRAPHELDVSHTVEKHIGKTDWELRERLEKLNLERGRSDRWKVSTFTSSATADQAIYGSVTAVREEIDEWLEYSRKERLVIVSSFPNVVGRVLKGSDQKPISTSLALVVLAKDRYESDRFFVLTAYPIDQEDYEYNLRRK